MFVFVHLSTLPLYKSLFPTAVGAEEWDPDSNSLAFGRD
jgi:hypothetical protein